MSWVHENSRLELASFIPLHPSEPEVSRDRTLRLNRETVAELTAEDLAAVVGGDATGGCPRSFRVWECVSVVTTCPA